MAIVDRSLIPIVDRSLIPIVDGSPIVMMAGGPPSTPSIVRVEADDVGLPRT
jgi:hypothetical protein